MYIKGKEADIFKIMENRDYQINKGVNRPIEFKGLKAQYIYFLAAGLAGLLILFCVMYIAGTPVYFCLILIFTLGAGLFTVVFRLSHKYGEHGLMKRMAKHNVPDALRLQSIKLFRSMNSAVNHK